MRPFEEAALLARTARHLRPAQIGHRVRLRAQRLALARGPRGVVAKLLPAPVPSARPDGWPQQFVPLDQLVPADSPDPESNANGRFCFLSRSVDLGDPRDWLQQQEERLWRFHLHYFEWAFAFAAHADRTWAAASYRELWRSWHDGTVLGHGDAWSPYVASLRAWAMCTVHDPLVAGSPLASDHLGSLAQHRRFLRAHQELDVGGNHLIKNLKALIGLGVFFGDGEEISRRLRQLDRQLGIQVLADGGHFERSPSYHCQVLGDLLDVQALLRAAARPAPPRLDASIGAMRRWLGTIVMPDGRVPLFNDGWHIGGERLAALGPTPAPEAPVTVMEPSGYAVVRCGDLHLVADIGNPCPASLPAHAHAGSLGFELAVGRRVLVNSGTSTYEDGPRRAYERSTAAHNTVVVDGADSTEVWGVFRAARRARARLESTKYDHGVVEVTASHDGYRRLAGRPVHRRAWLVSGGAVDVRDEITGGGTHDVAVSLNVGPDFAVQRQSQASATAGPLHIEVSSPDGPVDLELAPTEVATVFGCREQATKLVARIRGPLPVRLQTAIRLAP